MLKFLARFKLYRFLITTFIPSFSFYSRLTKEDYDLILSKIKDNDAILTRSRFALSSILVPGKYSHACDYYKENITEMVSTGRRVIHILNLLFHSDYICILRPPMEPDPDDNGFSRYDIYYSPKNNYSYCTEYVLSRRGIELGNKIWLPDDLLKLGWEKVFEI
jgi:hypothetical protein